MCVLFSTESFQARLLQESDITSLQNFYNANPEYSLRVSGETPSATLAREEFYETPPADMSYAENLIIGFRDQQNQLIGMAIVISDLLAPKVWHISLFIVASALHGKGAAAQLYAGLEDWIRSQGAHYLRLGVVIGNQPAQRFWQRMQYQPVKIRRGICMGQRCNDIEVMIKPLHQQSIQNYLAIVSRDRPDMALNNDAAQSCWL